MTSIYNIQLKFDDDIIHMIYDIVKFSIIQITTHLLFCIDNQSVSIFNHVFIKTIVFINFGLMIFWLLFRKIVRITNEIKDLKKRI